MISTWSPNVQDNIIGDVGVSSTTKKCDHICKKVSLASEIQSSSLISTEVINPQTY